MITSRQRLAAVAGKCFEGKTAQAKDELRHAAYSQFVGREIESSNGLTDTEVEQMLTLWEHWETPFMPSSEGRKQVNEYARQYQEVHGQESLPM
mgnify:CR=1 FL=1